MTNSVTNALLAPNLIHIPQTADTELVQLAKGQLLRATVQRVADEMALLNFGGKTLMVRTDAPLQAQQRVILQVSQVGPDQVSLQIVQQSPPPADAATTTALAPSGLESLLSSWDVTPDAVNQNIAKALFAQNQTVNPDAIEDVRSLWQQLPVLASLPQETGGKAGNLEALVYLHTNQLPVTTESISLARHLLLNSLPVAQNLTTLQTNLQTLQPQLQALAAKMQPSPTTNPTLTNLLTTVTDTLSQLANWTITDKLPPDQIMARLAEVMTRLGTPPESELANQLLAASTPTAPQPAAGGGERGPSPVLPENAAAVAAKTAPQPAAATPNADPAPTAAAPTNHQPGAVTAPSHSLPETASPLQRLTVAINQALSQPGLDKQTTQALHSLSTQLEAVTKDLGAIHLANVSNAPSPAAAAEPYYMFPIPLQTSDGPRTAQLRVYHRANQQAIDPKNLRLALLLDLPELGEVAINLTVFEKHLSGKFISEKSQTRQLIETDLKELSRSLRQLGYTVDSLTTELLPPEKPSIFTRPEPTERVEVPLMQIDITA